MSATVESVDLPQDEIDAILKAEKATKDRIEAEKQQQEEAARLEREKREAEERARKDADEKAYQEELARIEAET